MKANGFVSIRDGAYSRFNQSTVIQEFTPTQNLKGFLTKYVDENAFYRRRSQSEDDNPPSPITMEESHPIIPGGSSPFISNTLRGSQSPRDGGLRFPTPHTPPSNSNNPHTPPTHPNFNMTSPPAPHMPLPSPNNIMPSSPLNTQPSPMGMAHSPGPNNLPYMQQHGTDGSPFPALSPAAVNWPGSPSIPRPSPRPGQSPDHKSQSTGNTSAAGGTTTHINRVLPAKAWAGAVPTILTHQSLETMCRPSKDIPGMEISPLERFLGCCYMRRSLQKFLQDDREGHIQILSSNEPGVVCFKVHNIQYQVILNLQHMQSLHLKITQAPPNMTPDGKIPFHPEDLSILEQFFDTKVTVAPYRSVNVQAFAKLVTCPTPIIKDFIQIIRLELMPEMIMNHGLKWAVQLCMRVPPSTSTIMPFGSAAFMLHRTKTLFFVCIFSQFSTKSNNFCLFRFSYKSQGSHTQEKIGKTALALYFR